jgi:hypothetical protein
MFAGIKPRPQISENHIPGDYGQSTFCYGEQVSANATTAGGKILKYVKNHFAFVIIV